MEENDLTLDSSPSRPQEHEHLSSGSPLPPGPVPPPGPCCWRRKDIGITIAHFHRQDLRASESPLNTGLLWKAQLLQDLAKQSRHQQRNTLSSSQALAVDLILEM